MYKTCDTPEKRFAYRLEKFMDECNKRPMNLYRCDSIARVIDEILKCESGNEETEAEARLDMQEILTDAEVEDARMDEHLERDAL